jgi:AraC family transcriptional regulator
MPDRRQLSHDPLSFDARPVPWLRVRAWEFESAHPREWPAGAHPAVEIAWVESGGVGYRIGSQEALATTGQAFVVPLGVEHATRMMPGTKAGSVWMDQAALDEIADALPKRASLRLIAGLATRASKIARIGRLLVEEAEAGEEGAIAASEHLGEALAVEALRAAPSEPRGTSKPRDPRIRLAIDHLESACHEPLSIDALAKIAGMSRFHFSRRFREEIGASPYRYLISARVRRAAQLLKGGRCSVTEAAFTAGFTDLGRFASAFRRELGCAPSEMARTAARSARSAEPARIEACLPRAS